MLRGNLSRQNLEVGKELGLSHFATEELNFWALRGDDLFDEKLCCIDLGVHQLSEQIERKNLNAFQLRRLTFKGGDLNHGSAMRLGLSIQL